MEVNGKEVGAALVEDVTEEDMQKMPILGALTWFNLCDVDITKGDLEMLFNKFNIPEEFLPRDIKPENAFKRATTMLNTQWKNKSQPTDKDGIFYTFLVRNVNSTMDRIVRHVIAEIRDANNEKLDFKHIGSFVYKHNTCAMETTINPGMESMADILSEAETTFASKLQYYENGHIREIVLDLLNSTQPVNVRPTGGVFFVPKDGLPTLESLKDFIESLNDFLPADHSAKTKPASMDSVYVMDIESQRKLFATRFDEQIDTETNAHIAEMAKFLTEENRVIKKATLQRFMEAYKDANTSVVKYEALLRKDMEFARTRVDLMKQQLHKLIQEANVQVD
jgi:hypothetical protein